MPLYIEPENIQEEIYAKEAQLKSIQESLMNDKKKVDLMNLHLAISNDVEKMRLTLGEIAEKIPGTDGDELHKLKQREAELNAQISDRLNKQNEILDSILRIPSDEPIRKCFDKYKLFQNIKELLKRNKEVKIGQIETESGNAAGYMSRLDKPTNTSDPNVAFIVTAAKLLDVKIDFLLFGDVTPMSETESYIKRFIEQSINSTDDDSLIWNAEYANVLNEPRNHMETNMNHPLFYYNNDDWMEYYNSAYYEKYTVKPAGECYFTDLPTDNGRLYLMKCEVIEDDLPFGYFVYELYLIGKSVNPICCSDKSAPEVSEALKELYNTVQKSMKRVHINMEAKKMIDSFMEYSELPFK